MHTPAKEADSKPFVPILSSDETKKPISRIALIGKSAFGFGLQH